MHEVPASQGGNYFPQTSNAYGHYSPPAQVDQQTMHSSTIGGTVNAVPGMSSPIQFQQPSSQQVSPVQEMPANFGQPHLMNNPSFEASLFDPNDPTLLNFSIQDLNFGNHYGALEFGMLGHMTSGAVNTPEMEGVDSMTNSNHGSISFEGSTNYNASGLPYSQGYQNWQTVGSRQGSTTNLLALQHNGMDAYAVADVTSSLTGTSPNSQSMDWNAPYQSNTMSPELAFTTPDHTRREETHRHRSTFPSDSRGLAQTPHRRDTKQIYASVTAPYPYTQRFHNLIKHLERHYPSDKRVRIARALSMIRPSFISLAKDLNNDDLIFMEQSFQRALVEYEDRWSMVGTPSIICRRTGEIVTCSKEFSLVTGWRKDVLLGKEPNLNVNFGSGSGTQTGTSTRGAATPRVPNFEVDSSLPQPVFITEIMDQDSVVYFFERFAELGFSASASSMPSAQCSLIRYKTKDDPGWGTKDERARIRDDGFVKRERGPSALGDDTGEIPACMTWLVKQDIFDMPMMIVINVSLGQSMMTFSCTDDWQFLPCI